MSTTTPTPEEQPKAQVAKAVVAQKRQYFLPEQNLTVTAASLEGAVAKALKLKKKASKK